MGFEIVGLGVGIGLECMGMRFENVGLGVGIGLGCMGVEEPHTMAAKASVSPVAGSHLVRGRNRD